MGIDGSRLDFGVDKALLTMSKRMERPGDGAIRHSAAMAREVQIRLERRVAARGSVKSKRGDRF
jgi:hypothetical protein